MKLKIDSHRCRPMLHLAGLCVFLTACAPPMEVDSDAIALLMRVAQSEYEVIELRGRITITDTKQIPSAVLKSFSELSASVERLEIRFTFRDRTHFDIVLIADTVSVGHLVCDGENVQFSGRSMGSWADLRNSDEGEGKGEADEVGTSKDSRDGLWWLYFSVAEHLFPLSPEPSFDPRVFQSLLTKGGLSFCPDTTIELSDTDRPEDGTRLMCAECVFPNQIVWRYYIATGEPPYVLRRQVLFNEQVITDLAYASPMPTPTHGKTCVFMQRLRRLVSDQGQTISILTDLESVGP